MGAQHRFKLHRNDHGHRYHTCHHERCQTDPITRRLLKQLRAATSRSLDSPKRMTIAQARVG